MKQNSLALLHPSVCFSDSFFRYFPSTRYQGSKRKILPFLFEIFKPLRAFHALDLYSGTASVSLLLRKMGFLVTANDYMLYNHAAARFLLSVTPDFFAKIDIDSDLSLLFDDCDLEKALVSHHYSGVFFTEKENLQLDAFCQNISIMEGLKKDMYIYLMGQAMLMKRPYNLFHRANLEMRTRNVQRSFGNAKTWETPFNAHIDKLFHRLKLFTFSGPKGSSLNKNTLSLDDFDIKPDLIYLDPPYLNRVGAGVNYADFYHFLEGLISYDKYQCGNPRFPHKPIASYDTAWRTEEGGLNELERVIDRWPQATLVLSYRGDGKPTIKEVRDLFTEKNYQFTEHFAVDYKYALSKQDDSTEEVLVARRT